jgi:hypothetical protein
MKATDDDLRESLRRGVGRPRTGREGCPSSEAIARAVDRASASGTASEIAEHVAECPDCAFEYRLAASLKPWAAGAAAAITPSRPERPRETASRFLPLALAASLAMCLGLLGWAWTLRQEGQRLEARVTDADDARRRAEADAANRPKDPATEVATPGGPASDLAQPHANVPLVDLFPSDAARGAGSAASTIDAAGTPLVVVILNVRQPDPGAVYAVEIDDAEGRPIWAAEGVRAGSEPLTLAIPSSLLSGEQYRIRLHRVRGERRTMVEEYALQVARRERGSGP